MDVDEVRNNVFTAVHRAVDAHRSDGDDRETVAVVRLDGSATNVQPGDAYEASGSDADPASLVGRWSPYDATSEEDVDDDDIDAGIEYLVEKWETAAQDAEDAEKRREELEQMGLATFESEGYGGIPMFELMWTALENRNAGNPLTAVRINADGEVELVDPANADGDNVVDLNDEDASVGDFSYNAGVLDDALEAMQTAAGKEVTG